MIPPAANVPKLFVGNAQTNETGWKICINGDFLCRHEEEWKWIIQFLSTTLWVYAETIGLLFPFLLLLLLLDVALPEEEKRSG
jgi:hypothetical protein